MKLMRQQLVMEEEKKRKIKGYHRKKTTIKENGVRK